MQQCKFCKSPFEITEADKKVYKKFRVPPPKLCPECRNQRRTAFRNDQNFYKNTCSFCGKNLVSIYSPDKNIKVLCHQCFWSDRFDPLEHGQDFDFSRSFFDQYAEIRAKVPRLAIFNSQSENADFTVHSSRNKNCYMASSLVDCEDVHYSDWAMKCKDSMDLLMCSRMEFCYQCLNSQDCYSSNYLELCSNLTDSCFCFDCRNGKRLVGCVSMRNRKNHILNQPASKKECITIINKLKTNPEFFADFQKKYEALKMEKPKRDTWMQNVENCHGNHLINCKNAYYAFCSEDIEDSRYVHDSKNVKDGYDIFRVIGENIYETTGTVDLYNAKFCNLTYHSDHLAYCDNCQGSSYSFGCMSLKKHTYCILNKKYPENTFNLLLAKILEHLKNTGEYGEFFPIPLSPFGYNETKAQEFYPLAKEEVLAKKWKWSDYKAPLPENIKTVPADRLPNTINNVTDEILDWAILCEITGKPFRIIRQELAFYRKKGLPLPKRSPRQRHEDRVAMHNPRKLYERKCDKCQKKIMTTYRPKDGVMVYCEECYLKEVYY